MGAALKLFLPAAGAFSALLFAVNPSANAQGAYPDGYYGPEAPQQGVYPAAPPQGAYPAAPPQQGAYPDGNYGPVAPPPAAYPAVPVPPAAPYPYVFAGRNYCWYDSAWNGPGWYWCGYAFRNGYGWGGVYGWNGWRRGGYAGRGWRGGYGGYRH